MSELPTFKIYKDKGLHTSLFIYACRMAEDGVDPDLVEEHLKNSDLVHHNHRREIVPDREIEEAVEDAYNEVLKVYARKRIPPLSKYDKDKARNIFDAYGCNVSDLQRISPQVPPTTVREVLQAIYRPDDYVCMARKLTSASTKLLSKWLQLSDERLASYQFIVPNPMSAEYGLKKNGTGLSPRTYNNTGPRKFVVCDFDLPGPEIQPSLIAYLAEYCEEAPVLVLSSGNKSLHAWWRCDGLDEDKMRLFEDEAASVGADPAILGDARRNQLVRLPMGTRQNNQKIQQIYFWDPNQINNHE